MHWAVGKNSSSFEIHLFHTFSNASEQKCSPLKKDEIINKAPIAESLSNIILTLTEQTS